MEARQTSAGFLLSGIIHFLKVAPLLLVRLILLLLGARFTRKLDGGIFPHQSPEQTMIWSIFSVLCVIITAVVLVALLQHHLYYAAAFS